MVLFLFVIMLMNLNADEEPQKTISSKIIAGLLGGLLLLVVVGVLQKTHLISTQSVSQGSETIGLVKTLGMVLFKEFLFPFEIVSILLLAALVGAIMIGKREPSENNL